ncbi:cob(I)yrinic acid a,c-diamide adenosyltransferase [Propionibacterium australiense]|uniref:Corrinoid adenosyltransferase n=1 Tax=Propionibacterium australiense TaxID=119981 RepID=A0A383S9F9_9ACTN|nr:cob(I)yrinic acid a,c-diamide adenosyltransferase [Propionibacterium australiense]RLP10940.1 cob(I)yrinic acid a,c-diamide adenosyltransferase [Propionibacterium australiense]RLP13093.1 cob(I)yrinic acid a,c-diamide adenosyltransferase [Propionibacterium australiense]SYZ33896.1 cob(I)yrinic acid a,c-diamide adenosyltransferase [Propionibacterium australiense]VEH90902.1 Cob(I)yrinic acid a,c-diamide adenosyltransferase [Propionibacterium australiense]
MPNIYTRSGDKGMTGLFGGTRVAKQSPLVEAYGTVDEANSTIGEAKAAMTDPAIRATLHHIQQRMFTLAAELASDAAGREILDNKIGADDVTELERLIDECLAVTGPQRNFVVPGRDPISGILHRARTVVRRAERRVLIATESDSIRPEIITYLNRLSDALFALARLAEHHHDMDRVEQVVLETVARALGTPEGAAVLAGSTTPAGSGTLGPHDLPRYDLATLKLMAEAAEQKATEIGVPCVFAGVDAGGNLMLLERMAGSLLVSIEAAQNKAFTAAAFGQPTAELKDLSGPGGPIPGIQNFNDGRVVVFGGGFPVFVDGELAGGIGASGGTPDQDESIITHALATAQKESRS